MPRELAHVLAKNRKAQLQACSTGSHKELGGVWRYRLERAAGKWEGEDQGGRRDNKGSHVPAKRKESQVGPGLGAGGLWWG